MQQQFSCNFVSRNRNSSQRKIACGLQFDEIKYCLNNHEGDVAVRRRFSLIGSGFEDQISEITIFKYVFHITEARYLNHNRKENYAFGCLLRGDNSVLFTPHQKTPKFIPCSIKWELHLVIFLFGKYFLHPSDENTTLIGNYDWMNTFCAPVYKFIHLYTRKTILPHPLFFIFFFYLFIFYYYYFFFSICLLSFKYRWKPLVFFFKCCWWGLYIHVRPLP